MSRLNKLLLAGLLFQFQGPLRAADNLLVITIDTLRADRLSCYGYQANRTPHIDRWASEGVLFERAFAEVPLTLPSHSSLFTGTFPFYHGVRDNAGFVLSDEETTLAELLRDQGYRTGAFVGAYVVASRFGLAQGFETYDEVDLAGEVISGSSVRRPAEEVNQAFLPWLARNSGKSFFAWVHFYDPHAPWEKSYDGEISRVDKAIGAIDAELKRLDLLETTHIILASDHGEALGEHGESGHGFFVYDSTLRVPLIVRPAAPIERRGKRVETPVSLTDVLPTALQLLRRPVPGHVQGQGLLRTILGQKRPSQRPIYSESYLPQIQFGWSRLRSLRLGRYKLIDAPRPEFYDLAADPGELNDLFARRQALASKYMETLGELRSKFDRKGPQAPKAPASVDAAALERLASLGYAAFAGGLVVEDVTGEVDPKDKIAIFEEYQRLIGLVRTAPSQETLQRMSRLRNRDPQLRGLHFLEAAGFERLGRFEEARQAYEKALEENPDNNLARFNLANVWIRLRDFANALRLLDETLERDPADYRARNNAAMLRVRIDGDLAGAVSELEKVVDQAPGYVTGWFSLGTLRTQGRNWAEAEKAFRRVIELDDRNESAKTALKQISKFRQRVRQIEGEKKP